MIREKTPSKEIPQLRSYPFQCIIIHTMKLSLHTMHRDHNDGLSAIMSQFKVASQKSSVIIIDILLCVSILRSRYVEVCSFFFTVTPQHYHDNRLLVHSSWLLIWLLVILSILIYSISTRQFSWLDSTRERNSTEFALSSVSVSKISYRARCVRFHRERSIYTTRLICVRHRAQKIGNSHSFIRPHSSFRDGQINAWAIIIGETVRWTWRKSKSIDVIQYTMNRDRDTRSEIFNYTSPLRW